MIANFNKYHQNKDSRLSACLFVCLFAGADNTTVVLGHSEAIIKEAFYLITSCSSWKSRELRLHSLYYCPVIVSMSREREDNLKLRL